MSFRNHEQLKSGPAMVAIAVSMWAVSLADRARAEYRDRVESEDGLTTLEWALLVAGVAAMAIALVIVVRGKVGETQQQIPTNVNTSTNF